MQTSRLSFRNGQTGARLLCAEPDSTSCFMEIQSLIIFILSFPILWAGGSFLVRGAAGIGAAFGLGSFFVGFTLVAFGTSVPEFLVCLAAAFMGSSDIAIGNMVGSNIANMGLIFGLTALISPVVMTATAWREQKSPLALLLILTFLAFALSRTGFSIGRWEGVLLVLPVAVFVFFSAGKEKLAESENAERDGNWTRFLLFAIAGSVLLAVGAHLLVAEAVNMAATLGISELFIGAAVVALGTSLPELAASLAAAWNRQQEIVVGNIIGSNFFNLAFLGLVAVVRPVDVNEKMFGDKPEFWFLLGMTILFAFLVWETRLRKNRIGRKRGTLLAVSYLMFVYFISGLLS